MHPHGRRDYPTESANRAHSSAEALLRKLRDYCVNPTDAEDVGRDFSHLLPKIDAGISDLASVADLRGGSWDDPPNPRLLEVVAVVPDIVVGVHIATHVQRARGTESDLAELRTALSAARNAPPSSPYGKAK